MKYILGTKKNMTQIFDESGVVFPVTVVEALPTKVTQIKTLEKDGYDAVQVGSGEIKEKLVNKAQKGHVKDLGNFRFFKENRVSEDEAEAMKVGDAIEISNFEEGQKITVSSVSKGKGFQGVVKRHNFHGGPRSHGQKHTERSPGSIGAKGPATVFKGQKMPGRMGGDNISVKNLKIVKIDKENNIIYIKGAVPGRPGSLVEIRG